MHREKVSIQVEVQVRSAKAEARLAKRTGLQGRALERRVPLEDRAKESLEKASRPGAEAKHPEMAQEVLVEVEEMEFPDQKEILERLGSLETMKGLSDQTLVPSQQAHHRRAS